MSKWTAIVLANGLPCSQELTQNLLKTYPASIKLVLDGAMQYVRQYNILPDIWLGDFDHNLNTHAFLLEYPNLKLVHTPDQNYTDLEKALAWLQEQGFQQVHILWATGKRLDHTLNNVASIARLSNVFQKIVLYDDYSICFPLPKHFESYFAKGTIISLIPLGVVEGIVTKKSQIPAFE